MRLASAISSSRESDAASFSRGLYLLPSDGQRRSDAYEPWSAASPNRMKDRSTDHPTPAQPQRRRANATTGG